MITNDITTFKGIQLRKPQKQVRQSALSSFVWSFLEKAGNQVVSLVVQIVLARILAPSDFGTMAVMVVFSNLGTTFMLSGLNTAIIQKKNLEQSDPSSAFWLSFIISLIFCVLIWLVAPAIASFYQTAALVDPLRALSLTVVIGSLSSMQTALITRALNFKLIFVASSISLILSAATGIAIALAGGGIWSLVCQQLCMSIVNCIALTAQTKWLPGFVFSPTNAKKLYAFGWKLMVSGLLESIYQSLSDLIVGKLFNTSQLGFFSQGRKYPQAIGWALDAAMQPVILSSVSKLQEDLKGARQFVAASLRSACFIVMPSMFFLAACSHTLVPLLLGEQWRPIIPIFQLFAVTYAFISIQSVNLQTMNALGRSDLYLKIEVIKRSIGVAVLLFTSFVLQNVIAIAAGYLAVELISTFINARPNRKLINYSYTEQLKDIFPIFTIAAICAVGVFLIGMLPLPAAATLVFQAITMIVLYLGVCKVFNIREITLVGRLIQPLLRGNQQNTANDKSFSGKK